MAVADSYKDNESLRLFINEVAGKKFVLGEMDCVSFVVGCLWAGWQKDYSNNLRYIDRKSAVAQLRETGSLFDAVKDELGHESPIRDLSDGDIVYLEGPPSALGIILVDHIAVKTDNTIHRYTMDSAAVGWAT